jgi:hypothetical protein
MVKKINKVSKKKSLVVLKKRGKQRGGTNFIPFTKELKKHDVDQVYMTSTSLNPKALFKDEKDKEKSNITIKGPKDQKYEIYYVDSRNIHIDPNNSPQPVDKWAKTFFINDINEQGEIIANNYSNIEDNIDEIKKALNENYSLIENEIIESAKTALIKIQAAKAVKVTEQNVKKFDRTNPVKTQDELKELKIRTLPSNNPSPKNKKLFGNDMDRPDNGTEDKEATKNMLEIAKKRKEAEAKKLKESFKFDANGDAIMIDKPNDVQNMTDLFGSMHIGGKNKKSKKTRKHRGIIQTGGNTGRLRKGYKYSGKRLKNGMPEILKIKSKK